jgi:hypothetical protein
MALEPGLVTALTIIPALRPYSALKEFCWTLNSCTISIFGCNVIWFCTMSLRLIPSNR